jgi:hypothetical protein
VSFFNHYNEAREEIVTFRTDSRFVEIVKDSAHKDQPFIDMELV